MIELRPVIGGLLGYEIIIHKPRVNEHQTKILQQQYRRNLRKK